MRWLLALGIAAWWLAVDRIDAVEAWWKRRSFQPRVERRVARDIGQLVPSQRESVDPVWWEFVPQQRDGDDR